MPPPIIGAVLPFLSSVMFSTSQMLRAGQGYLWYAIDPDHTIYRKLTSKNLMSI